MDQEVVEIAPKLDAFGLHKKLCSAAMRLLKRSLPRLLHNAPQLIEQNEEEASYYKRRRPSDGRIDWKCSVVVIDRLIRALSFPYPAARTQYRGKTVLFGKAYPTVNLSLIGASAEPGRIESVDPPLVICGSGMLCVLRAQYLDQYQPPNPTKIMAIEGIQIGNVFFKETLSLSSKR